MRATPATVLLAALLACTAAAVAAAGPRKPLGKNGKQPNIILLLTGKLGSTCGCWMCDRAARQPCLCRRQLSELEAAATLPCARFARHIGQGCPAAASLSFRSLCRRSGCCHGGENFSRAGQ